MEGKSYLELLAENDEEARREFEPNAKDLLTAAFVEYDDDVGGQDRHPDELEDQEAFQKPQGSHQAATLGLPPEKDVHKTTTSVRYDKDTQIHVISVDSRFRTNLTQNPSDFLFKLLTPIKNAISVRMSSIEIPNTWYTFSNIRGNVSIVVNIRPQVGPIVRGRVVITQGNYTVNSLASNDILIELFTQLNRGFPNNSFGVSFNSINGLLTLSCFTKNNAPSGGYTYTSQPTSVTETPVQFSLNFADGIFSNRTDNWGLGYNLGYRTLQTEFDISHTADEMLDTLDASYVFVSLNPDWRVVEHASPDKSHTSAFAKVIVDVPKNDIVYDNGANTLTKTYALKQPTNITAFNIFILDEYEQPVQLMGGNVSMTLEVTEVLHASLYEAMRA